MRRFILALAAGVTTAAHADIRLPALISDHMVLQQERDVTLWGRATPGEVVRVDPSWLDVGDAVITDDEGRFALTVRTPSAGGPHTIVFRGNNRLEVKDVMIGEVWLCSGQSNMEMPVADVGPGYRGVVGWQDELARGDHPGIRLFDVRHNASVTPQDDCIGTWARCTPETLRTFSAVGYFFGRAVHEAIDVPIGLIGSNWGGTPAESWTSAEALRAHGGFDDTLDLVELAQRDRGALTAALRERLAAWWRAVDAAEPGRRARWHLPETDVSAWSEVTVPGAWPDAFDGFRWYRFTFAITPGLAGRAATLSLGAIDDMDVTWFDGVRVGAHEQAGAWNLPRRYPIPAELMTEGTHTIAVRVLDTGGGGGFIGAANDLALEIGDRRLPLAGTWRRADSLALPELPARPSIPSFSQHTPTMLHHGMIAPLTRYAIRGALWYQGESNVGRAEQYCTLFPAMITDWRRAFANPSMPFYFVQIAPFGYGNDTGQAAALRAAQTCARELDHVDMAVTLDVGNPTDIHPRNKQVVGARLAGLALNQTYGAADIICHGPRYAGHTVDDQGFVHVSFDHAAGGLRAHAMVTDVEIAGADGVWHTANIRLDGATLIAWTPNVPHPTDVRYAWSAAPDGALRSASSGLPMEPFSTRSAITPR